MNISYNWLKEYVNFDLTPDEVAAALTSIGLEINRSRNRRRRGSSDYKRRSRRTCSR